MGNIGNAQNKLFDQIVKEIKYELGIQNLQNEAFYYIDKIWFENFCKYINKEEIKKEVINQIQNSKKDIENIKISKPKNYKFNESYKPQNIVNNNYYTVKLTNLNNEINEIFDSSKYIKITGYLYNVIKKYFIIKNEISDSTFQEYYRIIIYDENAKNLEEKYIIKTSSKLNSERVIDIDNIYLELLNIYPQNYNILFSKRNKKEIKKYQQDTNNKELKKLIENLKYEDFFLIIRESEETLIKKKLFGTMGIANIENISYIISTIQCLSNIFPLTNYFLNDKYKNDINIHNQNSEGKIANCYAELMKVIWNEKVDLITKSNKEMFYFDPKTDIKKVNLINNLFKEIENNNPKFKSNEQEIDIYDFLSYFINILHEDLNRNKSLVKSSLYINSNTINSSIYESEEIKQLKKIFNSFISINDSIIIDIFYGIKQIIKECQICKEKINYFKFFDILSLPLTKSKYAIKEDEIEKIKIKSNNNLPSKSNFYFCKCIIIPYDNNIQKQILYVPIKKRDYGKIKIGDIKFIISYLYNIELNDLFPAVISDNNIYYKYICTGKEYLYEAFIKPDELKLFFIQINNEIKDIKLEKNSEELFDIFQNPQKYIEIDKKKESNIFNIGEDNMGSFVQICSDANLEKYSLFKLFNIVKNENKNKLFIICLPKIIYYCKNDTLKNLYNRINDSYQFENSNFNMLDDDKNLNFQIIDDLNSYYDKSNFDVTFFLLFKIESKEKKDSYLLIPYSNTLISDFIGKINNLITNNNNYLSYHFKSYRIFIVWVKHKTEIENMQTSFLIQNMKQINPYEELLKKNNDNNNKNNSNNINNNKDLKLYEILRYYHQPKKLENDKFYYCEKCKKNVTGIKNICIYSFPQVLIFYFKRSPLNNSIKIEFPFDDFDMSQFINRNNTQLKTYELICIINLNNNHYNAYCKNNILQKWFLFNDSECIPIENIKEEVKYENVIALFYKDKKFNKYNKY